MLMHLRITNFALLEEMEMDFGNGLTFLTGETGAGKSILIDAICRLLGARAAQDDVRAGASKAVLEAILDSRRLSTNAKERLREWQIDIEEEDLILRREIFSSGRSRAAINNCSVTLQQLRDLAPCLIDLFGQNEHQSLLDSLSQQQMYDASIGLSSQVTELKQTALEIQSLQREWKALQDREQQRQREIDLLRFQIREIEEANISEMEEQGLTEKKILMQNSERIVSLCDSLIQTILANDVSLSGLLKEVQKNMEELQKYKPELGEFISRFRDWDTSIQDLIRAIDGLKRGFDFEETSLDELEERLEIIRRLKKKYGPTISRVLEHLAQSQQDLQNLLHAEEREEDLLHSTEKAISKYEALADQITERRKAAEPAFAARVEAELAQVAMEKCRFRVRFDSQPIDENASLMDRRYPVLGRETIIFEIEANPGEGFRELSRIASGGELSRLMLALKVVNQNEPDSTALIFDEIDAGIGGRVAYQIGERLKKLSERSQVLCVTHLPQVAAFGDHHFRVTKAGKDSRTITVVEELADADRIRELARMFSGSEVTETALQHARELRGQIEARTS